MQTEPRRKRAAPPLGQAPNTVSEWISGASRRLAAANLHFGHGATDAWSEAAWIVASACRLSPRKIESHFSRPISRTQIGLANRVLDARIKGKIPLAYLLSEAWLGKYSFHVDRRVIVPRSFIAELIESGIGHLLPRKDSPLRALDLCTGSGCLAILLAKKFRGMHVDAVDISSDALEVARLNIKRHGLQSSVVPILSNVFDGISTAVRYDLIVANPPYVKGSSMKSLPAEYRHEPTLALAGGSNGLAIVSRIVTQAWRYLSPEGVLIVEIGHNRKILERAFPRLPFLWLDTETSEGMLALIDAKDLQPVG